jgi:hypothetical protein
VQGRRFHGHYASFNLKDHREIVHINIEKAADIQEQLVPKIAELAATPADVGEAVPVRLDVPATAAAELWDSGLPVAAHGRDTLETLAASYHVPLWAVAQVGDDGDDVEGLDPLVHGVLRPPTALVGLGRALAHALDQPLDMGDRRFRQDAVAEIENERSSRQCLEDRIDRAVERHTSGEKRQRIEIALDRPARLNLIAREAELHRPIEPDRIDCHRFEILRKFGPSGS